jgi:hypothetical protein
MLAMYPAGLKAVAGRRRYEDGYPGRGELLLQFEVLHA